VTPRSRTADSGWMLAFSSWMSVVVTLSSCCWDPSHISCVFCGYPTLKKNVKICLFVLTESSNVTDGQTDGRTLHDDIGRAFIASRGKKIGLAYVGLTTVGGKETWNVASASMQVNSLLSSSAASSLASEPRSNHSLVNTHSCSTSAETRDRKCSSFCWWIWSIRFDRCYHFVECYCQHILLRKNYY